jgi:phage shock protein E
MGLKIFIFALIFLAGGVGVYVAGGTGTKESEIIPDGTSTFMEQTTGTMDTIPTEGFAASIQVDSARTILDVRTPEEYAEGHLPSALNVDFYAEDFTAHLESLPREAPYAIYCRSGNRSGKALEQMRTLGFTDVRDLRGGMHAWAAENRPVCTEC